MPDPSFPILADRLAARVRADRELTHGAKLTFDAIVRVSKWAQARTGFTFPSYAKLAEIVCRGVRMVGNYLRELRERGYLTWARKQRAPNVYALNLALVSASPPSQAVPEGWKVASEGYLFAGGRYSLRGVRELLRGAAAVQAGVAPLLPGLSAPALLPPGELAKGAGAPMSKLSAAAFGAIMRGHRHG